MLITIQILKKKIIQEVYKNRNNTLIVHICFIRLFNSLYSYLLYDKFFKKLIPLRGFGVLGFWGFGVFSFLQNIQLAIDQV